MKLKSVTDKPTFVVGAELVMTCRQFGFEYMKRVKVEKILDDGTFLVTGWAFRFRLVDESRAVEVQTPRYGLAEVVPASAQNIAEVDAIREIQERSRAFNEASNRIHMIGAAGQLPDKKWVDDLTALMERDKFTTLKIDAANWQKLRG